MSNIEFHNRVAIVTGAGRGIGRNYAIELAGRGANVVVNDIGSSRDGIGLSASPANKVVEEIKNLGGEAVADHNNVATLQGGRSIVDTAIDAFGRVDILINNAGILIDKTFANMDEKSWDVVIDVNLKGAYNVTKPAFNYMKTHGYGRIIMITSGSGMFGNIGQANYASAKMGLVGLANVLKLEGARHNIKTNVLAPMAATRMTKDVVPPEIFKKMKVDFVTSVMLYMCSEQCQDSGVIINAGFGYFSRSAILTGLGVCLSDGKQIPTPENVMKNWNNIKSLEKAKLFNQLIEMYNELISLSP